MDQNLVYTKTPIGDDAVRQSTRVVQRNLRLVLVQVDGKTPVGELAAKVGNLDLVENALKELEEGGFIAPVLEAPSVWETGKKVALDVRSAISEFSTFGPKSEQPNRPQADSRTQPSAFSSFGKPIFPTSRPLPPMSAPAEEKPEPFRPPRRIRMANVLWLLIGLLGLLCLTVVFYPYNRFKPDIEAALAHSLQTPVKIGNLSLGVLPRPALTLDNVVLGEHGEARIDEIRVPSLLSLIGRGRHEIPVIDIQGMSMPVDSLGVLAAVGNGSAHFSIGRAKLKRLALKAGDLVLPSLEGEISAGAGNAAAKVQLQTEDRTLRIEAVPSPMGAVLKVEGYAWKPAESSPYVFESLQARGLLQRGKLILQDVDTTFLGGVLRGNWLLDWSSGMAMAGELTVARLDMRRVAGAFAPAFKTEGELSGGLHLRGSGDGWKAMWRNVEAVLDADITRGAVIGVDLGEAVRRGSGLTAGGGSTKFDRLQGAIRINSQQVSGSDIRMEAGLITANGHFVADGERKVDGIFDVSIRSTVSGVHMPVRVSGILPNLTAAAGR